MTVRAEYALHGLAVHSDIPLPDARPADGSSGEALTVVLAGARPVPAEVPPGDVLAAEQHASQPGHLFYVLVDRGHDDLVLRVFGVADVELGRESETLTVRPSPCVDLDLLGVLVSGLVLGAVLLLRGHTVLHASAVEADGSCLVFTGYSGMGKSTLASLACTAGGAFVTDDVLRLDRGPDGHPLARLGGIEARLRAQAATLAIDARTTADGRWATHLPVSDRDLLPVRSILVPMPVHGDPDAAVAVRWLAPKEAVVTLASLPRVAGWTDAVSSRTLFDGLCDVAMSVPIGLLTVPWGPPFAAGTAARVIELALSARAS